MDHERVLGQKENTEPEDSQQSNRRPVTVTVTRTYPPKLPATDINNNQTRIFSHPVNPPRFVRSKHSVMFDLPPVSLCFSLLLLFIYFTKELIGATTEEKVYVSWKTVIQQREVWRIFVAQFFHFGSVHIFFNVVPLMGIGRFLEKKIQKPAFALLILGMSAISNLFYITICGMICTGPQNEYSVGFSTVMFSLKMLHIFTMDSDANFGKGDPNLILGFFPVHLPAYISPWQPVLEAIFFDIFIIGKCIASTVSGMIAASIFPYLVKHYRDYIIIQNNPPPAPPKIRPRNTTAQQQDDLSNNNNEADLTDTNDNDNADMDNADTDNTDTDNNHND